MTTPLPVIICDDSSMARKQMARALMQWNVEITYSENGLQALEQIRAGHGDLLFLDLTMPVMDGYQVLERIRRDDLPTMVVVVSADIQPDAQQKVLEAGALAFVRKPLDLDELSDTLGKYGILPPLAEPQARLPRQPKPDQLAIADPPLTDSVRELANIAMGFAADRLARLLDAFVDLPLPKVDMLNRNDLSMTLDVQSSESAMVCQGFCATGIAGEALLMFKEWDSQALARLLQYPGEVDEAAEREMLSDIATHLIGAFMSSLGHQLDLSLSLATPCFTAQAQTRSGEDASDQSDILSIEISYLIQEYQLSCDLLVLFTEDSLSTLNERVGLFS